MIDLLFVTGFKKKTIKKLNSIAKLVNFVSKYKR